MISAWWLLIIIPASAFVGILIMARCAADGRAETHEEVVARPAYFRGEVAKLAFYLLCNHPDEIGAAEDNDGAVDIAIALLADRAKLLGEDGEDE